MVKIKDKGEKFARYRALKLKEKALTLHETEGITYEEALNIVTEKDIRATRAIRPKKKRKRHNRKTTDNISDRQSQTVQASDGKRKKRKIRKGKGIKLISKRGTTIKGQHACSNCSKVVDNPTRYSESNQGPVVLCAICKTTIRRNSFQQNHYDALDFAKTGGSFEGNRRKH